MVTGNQSVSNKMFSDDDAFFLFLCSHGRRAFYDLREVCLRFRRGELTLLTCKSFHSETAQLAVYAAREQESVLYFISAWNALQKHAHSKWVQDMGSSGS